MINLEQIIKTPTICSNCKNKDECDLTINKCFLLEKKKVNK